MKKLNSIVSIFFIGAFLMSACNLGAMPQATSEPGSAIQPPVGTEPPVLTEVPIQPTQPQTITQAPVDLSGPPMEVGSKFLYVDGSTLVAVPGGPFTMGHGGGDNPEHEVNVSDFWLYRSKVTNSQYALCVLLGKCSPPNVDKNGGYGDPVRVHPSMRGEIRRSLLTRAHSDDVAAAHVCAAGVWARADGATSPRALGLSEAAAWVEKVHHLGQGGAATYAEWLAQAMPSPEFYWDAARTLSMKREYDAAAALYRLCVEAFPRDPYAHHYLAYNLEQAGRRKADVRAHYRTACELDADNAWWNARYITHLISTHRWIDARAAWRRALEKIDPDGTLVGQHAWLVAHLHYWVAKAWADEGAWVEARSLLASIPGAVRAGVEHTRPLSALFARVDALRDQELSQFTEFLDTELDPTWRDRVREVWSQLLHHAPGIPAPAVSTDDDEARLIWSLSGVNIELGLEADGSSTWGAFDHLDQRSGGGESSTDHVTDELATWLRRARDHA